MYEELFDLISNEPTYDNSPAVIVSNCGKSVKISIYRGTNVIDTTNVVSWWTTEYEKALSYSSSHDKGFVIERLIELPIQDGFIQSPSPYLYGGHKSKRIVDLSKDGYLWGVDCDHMRIKNLPPFCISINGDVLETISTIVNIHY